MGKVYGYCRVSTATQKIERQQANILRFDPSADIRTEKYTGTKIEGREQLQGILRVIEPGDTIIFDSVSRMSRNAEDGIALYLDLYNRGVNLVFLKERHIDTATYRKALDNKIEMTGTDADLILEGVNKYLMRLAKNQIQIAFDQAQKEVDDLRERTKEGIKQVKRADQAAIDAGSITEDQKRFQGRRKATEGTKTYEQQKIIKDYMRKHMVEFGGTMNDTAIMNAIKADPEAFGRKAKVTKDGKIWKGFSRPTYYRYKKELLQEAGLI